ncbi:putative girdin-like [Cocos nucifera]|nr:putative girdin-like [Cocos nucifera]
MFTKFTEIINTLNGLGKIYSDYDLICKVLRSLPKDWEAKMTAIQEAKDLTKLSLEELMGSLMTHEMHRAPKEDEEEPKKMKTIAFKSTSNYQESDESKEDEEKDDEGIVLLSRKFKNFLIKKDIKKKKKKEKKIITNNQMHPKKMKRSALPGLLKSGDSSSSDEEEEMENLCLMTLEDEKNFENSSNFTFDKLLDAFNELIYEFKKLR